MKKSILISLITLTALGIGALVIYKLYFPHIVAEAIVAEQLPPYIPRSIKHKIEEIRKPLNKGAEEMIVEMHKAEIPVNKVLETIDLTTEDQANAMLDELAAAKPKSPDEVFDIGKKYFPADYDVEVFRKPFNEHVNMKMIRKAMRYGNVNRKTKDIDMETLKLIAKKLLLEKEQEYQSPGGKR